MPSERVQRHIDRLLDEADQAVAACDWATVRERVAEAAAEGVPAAPSQVIVVHSPGEQAVFEAGVNECGRIPGCVRQIANVVDLRALR